VITRVTSAAPAFAAEMDRQVRQARRALDRAIEAQDGEAADVAAARLADLADVARRHDLEDPPTHEVVLAG
jgi:hypothetical protein